MARAELRPTLGPLVCDWIEAYLCHGPGDVQGQEIVLDDELRAFVWRAYELHPQGHPRAGRRVYGRACFSRPKGRAKSELAGMVACVEALGPVRFDGWDADGFPVGRPILSPVVRCFATEEDQAGNTFDNAFYMLANGAVFDEYPGLDIGKTRIITPDGGEIVALTSAASSKDGGKDTFNVFDETHLWASRELKKLHATVTRNLIKRKAADGWALETTTMYAPGEDSVAEETDKAAKALPELLYDHKGAPLDVDVSDKDALREALRYVYGPASEWMDIDRMVREFDNPQTRESDRRRYWLNQPWTTEEKFTTPQAWDAIEAPGRVIEDGTPVVLALDGSYNNDSTALVVVTAEEIPHADVAGVWERPETAGPEWTVDVLDVEEVIADARRRWDVREITADPFRWARTLKVVEDSGAVVSEYPQTAARMTPATNRLNDLIVTRGMTHSGHEALRRHVLNAELKNDSRGKRLAKENKSSAKKIDLAVALVMGVDRVAFATESEGDPHIW